jgi:hypothetical protein
MPIFLRDIALVLSPVDFSGLRHTSQRHPSQLLCFSVHCGAIIEKMEFFNLGTVNGRRWCPRLTAGQNFPACFAIKYLTTRPNFIARRSTATVVAKKQ